MFIKKIRNTKYWISPSTPLNEVLLLNIWNKASVLAKSADSAWYSTIYTTVSLWKKWKVLVLKKQFYWKIHFIQPFSVKQLHVIQAFFAKKLDFSLKYFHLFAGALGPLVSNPGSPSRLIPPSQNSPYLPHLPQLSGPVGTPTPSILPNVGVGSINRVSTQSTDKTKLSKLISFIHS